jgi:hypothetical protein
MPTASSSSPPRYSFVKWKNSGFPLVSEARKKVSLNRINSIVAQGAAQDALVNYTVFPSINGVEDPKRGNNSSSDVLADSNAGEKKAVPKHNGSKKGEHSQKS